MSGEPPSYDSAHGDLKVASSSNHSSEPPAPSTLVRSRLSARHSPSISGLIDVFRKTPPAAVRKSVFEDARIAVQPNTGTVDERVALLARCAKLCTQHKIDFTALLQEKTFHKYTALYWAIVNNPGPSRGPFDLVGTVLRYSGPLKKDTIKEARQACLSLGNQELFQFLRMCPEFGALPEEDRFLLDTLVPPEEIELELMEGPEQPFSVKFKIPMYRKRMMLARQIKIEFIARERMWCFSFFTPANSTLKPKSDTPTAWFNKGQWGTSLQLVEDMSRSTPVQCGMVLIDEPQTARKPEHSWSLAWPAKPLRGGGSGGTGDANDFFFAAWWATFGEGLQGERPCIHEDGSITGILGVKLSTLKNYPKKWPTEIPTKADDECVVC